MFSAITQLRNEYSSFRGIHLKQREAAAAAAPPPLVSGPGLRLHSLCALGSYTSSPGLGSPCLVDSTSSIQPGMEKSEIFIENAASLFLLPKVRVENYTPCGRRCWDRIKRNGWERIRLQHRHLVDNLFLFISFYHFFPVIVISVSFYFIRLFLHDTKLQSVLLPLLQDVSCELSLQLHTPDFQWKKRSVSD